MQASTMVCCWFEGSVLMTIVESGANRESSQSGSCAFIAKKAQRQRSIVAAFSGRIQLISTRLGDNCASWRCTAQGRRI